MHQCIAIVYDAGACERFGIMVVFEVGRGIIVARRQGGIQQLRVYGSVRFELTVEVNRGLAGSAK